MTDQKEQGDSKQDIRRKNIFRRFLQVTFTVFLTALILFMSSGRFDWIWAWVYLITYIVVVIVNAIIFSPELISERGRKKENVEKWDKVVTGLIMIPLLALYVVSSITEALNQAGRYSTSYFLIFIRTDKYKISIRKRQNAIQGKTKPAKSINIFFHLKNN